MAPSRVVDALVYRYTSSGVMAYTVVEGHDVIRAFKAAGWRVLIHAQDVHYADLEETRQLDIQRFSEWRQAWDGNRSDEGQHE